MRADGTWRIEALTVVQFLFTIGRILPRTKLVATRYVLKFHCHRKAAMWTVGQIVRERREALGLTLAAVAEEVGPKPIFP